MRTMKNWALAAMAAAALALAGCGGGGGSSSMPEPPGPTPAQLAAMATTALNTAETAVDAVTNDSDAATVTAADNAVASAATAVAAASESGDHAALSQRLGMLQGSLASKKASRQTAMDDAQDAADMAMAVTAAKLFSGISAPAGDGTGASDRFAAYSGTNDSQISVTFGDGTTAGTAIVLSEDKKTTVAANHGWAGKRYADPAGGDSVEAVVYSNVEAPKEGRKFGSSEPGTGDNRAYEYTLANGTLTADEADGVGATDNAFVASRVAFTGVTRTAGTETFRLPSPNPQGVSNISASGSYHGVSGTYYCTPSDPAAGCSAVVAAKGFTLGGGVWTFKPGNAEARVMSGLDTAYASYGWWLHKTENGKTFTASAFHDFKGTAGTVDIADLVGGTATYMGGAAGKYALSSATGGTNDAGHFTARAMLEADFEDDTITGTIDMFKGADGMDRDWSVELKEAAVGTDGAITRAAANDTVWTIGGTASAASGEWSGNLREEGTDGVPKAATGTFYSTYGQDGQDGKIVGGFGANVQ